MGEKKPILAQAPVVIGLAILCNALWGSAIPFINLGYRLFEIPSSETATQILFAGCRFFLAGALTILFGSIPRRRLIRPKLENLHMVVKLAMLQTVTQYVLFYIGVARTTSVKGAIIQGLNAFVAILIACYVFRSETMNRLKWIGGAVGVAGVVLVNLSGDGFAGGVRLTGEGFLFLSMIASACSAGAIKLFSTHEDPVALSGWQFMLGGAIMAAAGFALGGRLHPTGWGAPLVLLYLAAVSAVAYTVWALLLKYNPVSRIAPYMFLQPIFGVLLSLLLYGGEQAPLLRYGAALVLVCLSIVLIGRGQREKA
ncbi:MAG: DMT family transporter [Christensenellales bacterium]|nr:DMT family transporter [Christensenellales bacterium]